MNRRHTGRLTAVAVLLSAPILGIAAAAPAAAAAAAADEGLPSVNLSFGNIVEASVDIGVPNVPVVGDILGGGLLGGLLGLGGDGQLP
ncbi:hypothetical protein [Promicromonospora iranensis]|uniref:Outer membrane lipoprotein SlyB n=1 Tax=Promicromonospora iranensis TaxID=1105144 RepID=A0ABU2CIP1_9MICO|nr:hypothetical protein [Promicromonospora iranensis]MDR7381203.1 outer membrane lipoprotein SlyB [Promicromonospora iranensis]